MPHFHFHHPPDDTITGGINVLLGVNVLHERGLEALAGFTLVGPIENLGSCLQEMKEI